MSFCWSFGVRESVVVVEIGALVETRSRLLGNIDRGLALSDGLFGLVLDALFEVRRLVLLGSGRLHQGFGLRSRIVKFHACIVFLQLIAARR